MLWSKKRAAFCFCFLVSLLSLGFSSDLFAVESEWPGVTLAANDRILILAPHPDDEVIGCAGIIQKAVSLNLPVRIIFLTYGDFNQWAFLIYRKHPVLVPKAIENMGVVRHDEAIAAAENLGLKAKDLIFLGYPDFGTMNIWDAFWGDRPSYRSLLTRANKVPYHNAFRPGAPYKGEEILHDLTSIFKDFKPTKIFVTGPFDSDSDHRSLYLFLRISLLD